MAAMEFFVHEIPSLVGQRHVKGKEIRLLKI